jgi:hypothetical protein
MVGLYDLYEIKEIKFGSVSTHLWLSCGGSILRDILYITSNWVLLGISVIWSLRYFRVVSNHLNYLNYIHIQVVIGSVTTSDRWCHIASGSPLFWAERSTLNIPSPPGRHFQFDFKYFSYLLFHYTLPILSKLTSSCHSFPPSVPPPVKLSEPTSHQLPHFALQQSEPWKRMIQVSILLPNSPSHTNHK